MIKLWAKANNIYNKENIILESRYWFNPPLSSRYFLASWFYCYNHDFNWYTFDCTCNSKGMGRGTMEALMATPATMSEIIYGKTHSLLYFRNVFYAFMFYCCIFWYEIPFMGSFFFILIILSSIYLFSSLSIGLLISTLAKNQFVAAQMSLIVGFLPAFILSGFYLK